MKLKTPKKQGNIQPLLLCAALAVLLSFGLQALLIWNEELASRRQARYAAHVFVRHMNAMAEREQERLDAMALQVQEGTGLAMEKKEAKREALELLILVNPWNELPADYAVELEAVSNSHSVDVRAAEPLRQMIADCFSAGATPWLCSSYRTQDYQQMLYENKISRLLDEGYSPQEAPAVAARSVAVPGTSEHQLGLAVDIIDEFFPDMTQWQEYTYTQQWLLKNCWRYGFILRYPNGSTDITGIIYEPWHYRYVGEDVAAEIQELGITFEEYLQQRRGR